MPGVDLVINALLETSGLRCDADCERAVVVARASKTKETKKKLIGFTALILFLSAECKAAKHCRTPKGGRHYKLISRSRFGVRRCSAVFDFLTHYLLVL